MFNGRSIIFKEKILDLKLKMQDLTEKSINLKVKSADWIFNSENLEAKFLLLKTTLAWTWNGKSNTRNHLL